MKSAKTMYDSMTNSPTRASMGHTTQKMDVADKMFPGPKDKKMSKGGKTASKVNAAGNYTKPELRKRIVSQVKAAATQGTAAGQWSARKAQLVAKKYKAAGGGYKD